MEGLETVKYSFGVSQNLDLLAQAQGLLADLDQVLYAKCCEPVFKASIGQHLRHAVEHYEAVLRVSEEDAVVDYEHRRRDLAVESDPQVASERILDIISRLSSITDENLPLTMFDHGGGSYPSPTSLGRELQFLASHTVHHFAMIGIIARHFQISLDPGFGLAPSTLRHRENA